MIDPGIVARRAEQARNGDIEAFGEVVLCCQAPLRGYLARLGVPGPDQEELAQDILVDAFTDLGTWDPARPFLPWLWGIARHRVLRRRGSRAGGPRRTTALDEVAAGLAAPPAAGGDDWLADPDLGRRLRRCRERLSAQAARLLQLHYDLALPVAALLAAAGVTWVGIVIA